MLRFIPSQFSKKLPARQMSLNFASSKAHSTSTMGRFSGKVAIVTGSTDGIGFAIAKKLADEGSKVVICSRNKANVDNALTNLKNFGHQNNISGVVCHVANSEDRKNLYEEATSKFGGIDILVSNAAVNPTFEYAAYVGVNLVEFPEEMWDKVFDVNVKSAFLLTKEVVPYLKERNGGSIVYITSIAAYHPAAMLGPYSVSKTALLGLTKVFALELAAMNIRVNSVAPGVTRTRFASKIFELDDGPLSHNTALSLIPMKRFGEPSDIAGVAAFLCSEDAKYITGETIAATGGILTRL